MNYGDNKYIILYATYEYKIFKMFPNHPFSNDLFAL